MKQFTVFLIFISSILIYSQEPTKKEINWLKEHIKPLNSFKTNTTNNDDLKILNEIIGNARVVSLGEVTHGSSEIYQMKHRITKYLATKKGFDYFSLEANMPEANRINSLLRQTNSKPKELLKDTCFWLWNTQETLDLFKWMKEYKKMKFSGFDMQFYKGALDEFSKYQVISKEKRTKLEQIFSKFQKKRYDELYLKLNRKDKKEVKKIIESVKNKINLSNENKNWLFQNCRIIEQFITNLYKNRDKYMAENFLWLKNQNPTSKFIISAHNGHIQNSYGYMGNILKDKLKNEYLSIGFAINTGTFSSEGKKGLSIYKLQDAYKGTYEYYFQSTNEPYFILDLREFKENKNNEWLFKKQKFRTIGAVYHKQQFEQRNLTKDYDVIIFINKSTNSKLLNKNHT